MNKIAIITGGAKGIGRAISLKLAQEGYKIAIIYNKSQNSAEELVKTLNEKDFCAIAVKADVRDYGEVSEAVNKVISILGYPSLLVNNAGIAHSGLLMDMAISEWKNIVATNLDSVFYFSKEVLPYMINNGYGKIINISSVWGIYGASCEVAYSATKAGIIGLTKALAQEVGGMGINVNCIAPGFIATEMNLGYDESHIQQIVNKTPLERVGVVEDIAQAVAYLASDSANFITGEVLSVGGGFKG